MTGDNAIDIQNLHKRYGRLRVLRGVDLTVARGEAFGLLGPNGAGKSTLIHLLLGMLLPDAGTVKLWGSSAIERHTGRIGYLPERPRYHTQFTGREYLLQLGRLSGLRGPKLHDRVDAVLDIVGMERAAERRVGAYSKGMLQRLGLAQALLHEPELLIVDEPASGLDPEGQRDMAELLLRVRAEGHTVFLCTHQLAEVDHICDRVGVLARGRMERTTSIADLRAQGHSVTIQVRDLPAETAETLARISPNLRCTRGEVVIFPTSEALQASVLRALLDDDVAIVSVVAAADALEQFYLDAIHTSDHVSNGAAPPRHEEQLLEALVQGDDR